MTIRKIFTRNEISLCIYAALYDITDIGGIDSICFLESRSPASIKMKIQNIIAMCDETGINGCRFLTGLSGRPPGEFGRQTNLNELLHYVKVDREQHRKECLGIVEKAFSWPGELTGNSSFHEGIKRRIEVNSYERAPVARRKCIEYYGPICIVCKFDFLATFGPAAKGFIHVHHLVPLSKIGNTLWIP